MTITGVQRFRRQGIKQWGLTKECMMCRISGKRSWDMGRRTRGNKDYQEKGLDILVKKGVDETQTNTEIEGYGQGAMETYQTETPMFKFESASKGYEEGGHVGLDLTKDREGPIAMTYDMELGWVTEALGPTSGHW